jgi:hypothetical protein
MPFHQQNNTRAGFVASVEITKAKYDEKNENVVIILINFRSHPFFSSLCYGDLSSFFLS